VQIYCDFDGTVTMCDTTDAVLSQLALPEWEALEADWTGGRITAAECMRRQVALIQGSDTALDAVLDRVELRPGFLPFLHWCESQSLPLFIVSDGVDGFISRVLKRHGLSRLPVFANRLAGVPGARRLEQPWAVAACSSGSGVCKCRVAQQESNGLLVYIGDGRSDFCVAREADLLFARGELARHCTAERIPFIAYDTFAEIHRYLYLMQRDLPMNASCLSTSRMVGLA